MALKIRRLQFPGPLAFAVTINKAQGQSLDILGLDLTKEVFGHGQLHVALSHVTNAENLTILLPSNVNGEARMNNTCSLPSDHASVIFSLHYHSFKMSDPFRIVVNNLHLIKCSWK
jgi:hypothetical protein